MSNYKRSAFWLALAAVLALVLTAGCMLTDPEITEPTASTSPTDPAPTNPTDPTDPTDPAEPPEYVYYGYPGEQKRLKTECPMYFDLDTTDGLAVYVWQMAEDAYYYSLLPGKNGTHTPSEIWSLPAVSRRDMRIIVASYFPGIAEADVAVIPITNPVSSYAYTIDEAYTQKVTDDFWYAFPVIDTISHALTRIVFDVDHDGKPENCTLFDGPTSGIYTLCFTVVEDGDLEYYDIYDSRWYASISFQIIDGDLFVQGITSPGMYQPSETHLYAISFKDGRIVMTRQDESNEVLRYWDSD